MRDLIWVNVAQALKIKREGERENEILSAKVKMMETLYLTVCDLRELSRDTNFYMRFEALKGTRARKVTGFDTKDLPSVYVEQERKEEERRAKMTPEELAEEEIRAFMSGKTIRRR